MNKRPLIQLHIPYMEDVHVSSMVVEDLLRENSWNLSKRYVKTRTFRKLQSTEKTGNILQITF